MHKNNDTVISLRVSERESEILTQMAAKANRSRGQVVRKMVQERLEASNEQR